MESGGICFWGFVFFLLSLFASSVLGSGSCVRGYAWWLYKVGEGVGEGFNGSAYLLFISSTLNSHLISSCCIWEMALRGMNLITSILT
jgi:hypothetical protein